MSLDGKSARGRVPRGHAAGAGRGRRAFAWVLLSFALAAAATADEGATDAWDALTGGEPTLFLRGRIEIARTQGLNRSAAYTLESRIGYETKPWYGVSSYLEFENVASATLNSYFTPTRLPNVGMKTVIPDQPTTQISEGYLKIARPDWLGTTVIGGRQRIVYDDSRFIGDVVWRQDQQTYDAAQIQTSVGIDNLMAKYGYIGNVNRVFGGGGNNPQLSNFNSSSNIVNVGYDRFKQARVVAFAYLLDLKLPYVVIPFNAANSSKTFGLRVTGDFGLGENWTLGYIASYAYQSQYDGYLVRAPQNANVLVSQYHADYYWGSLSLARKGLGRIEIGYEELGSDGGLQQFQTPLATLHKFNGWADVFLNSGGPVGLRDFFASVSPQMPWGLKLAFIYHHFRQDAGNAVFGNEIDASLGRSFRGHLDLLFKSAYYVEADGSPLKAAFPTTYRVWFEATVKF